LIKKRSFIKYQSTKKYDKSNIAFSIVDFSVSYGLQGYKYIEETQMNLQYLVLQAALVLTVTIPLYVSPPELIYDNHYFSFFVGFSAFIHIIVIVSVTAFIAFLNKPYTNAETMIIRVETMSIYGAIFVGNYVSMLAFITAVLIAGFQRSSMDGGLMTFVIVLVICLLISCYKILKKGDDFQEERVLELYNKYCMSDGTLKPTYMNIALGKSQIPISTKPN
jgi:hypothetical protein